MMGKIDDWLGFAIFFLIEFYGVPTIIELVAILVKGVKPNCLHEEDAFDLFCGDNDFLYRFGNRLILTPIIFLTSFLGRPRYEGNVRVGIIVMLALIGYSIIRDLLIYFYGPWKGTHENTKKNNKALAPYAVEKAESLLESENGPKMAGYDLAFQARLLDAIKSKKTKR